MKHAVFVFSVVLLICSPLRLLAQNKESAPEAKNGDGGAVHVVKKGPFRVKLQLDGRFEAVETEAISIVPNVWKSWVVTEAVPHGSRVKAGDVLLRFDSADLEEEIAKLEADAPLATLALGQAEAALTGLKESTPLKAEAAAKAKAVAEDDLRYFESTDRKQKEESARFAVKRSEQSLSYVKEELKQLEKMYQADDLTEETEEIILTRARNQVESAERSWTLAKLASARALTTMIAREHTELKDAAKNAAADLKLAEATLPRALEQKELEVAKMKRDAGDAEKKLAELKEDLAQMVLRAPSNGFAYYGPSQDGKWAAAPALAKKLTPGGSVAPRETIYTVAKDRPLRMIASVPENKLGLLTTGLTGYAAPLSTPGSRLEARVKELSPAPLVGGGFAAEVHVKIPESGIYVPGMAAKLHFSVFEEAEVIAIPSSGVAGDAETAFVWVKTSDGVQKRSVETGFSDGSKTVILTGLSAGDSVVVEKK